MTSGPVPPERWLPHSWRRVWMRVTTLTYWHITAWILVSLGALYLSWVFLDQAASRAEETETRRLAADSASRAERDFTKVQEVLTQLQAPPLADVCSTEFIAALNQLDFAMAEVKEFGGFNEQQGLACTSRLGVLPTPLPPHPDDAVYGPAKVMVSLHPLLLPTQQVYAMKVGRLNALLEEERWGLDPSLTGFSIQIVDRATARSIFSTGDMLHVAVSSVVQTPHFKVTVGSDAAFATQWRADRLKWMLPGWLVATGCAGLILWRLSRRVGSVANQLARIVHFNPENVTTVYQPIIAVAGTEVVGAETLLRMRDARGKPMPPNVVFSELEDQPALTRELTRLILERTFSETSEWLQEDRNRFIAVNLSHHDLSTPSLVPYLRRLLRDHRIEPAQLHLELLESAEFTHDSTLRILQDLRALGCSLWIDDFGVGYSNLARLHMLPVQGVKLDREWVEALDDHQHTRTDAVAHLVLLAGSNGLDVVAEGVSDELAMRTLLRLGITKMQGFLFSPGLPAADFLRLSRATGDKPGSYRLRQGWT